MLRELSIGNTETQSEQMLLGKKNGAEKLTQSRVATNFQFVKNTVSMMCNKVKHNKMRCAYNCFLGKALY